MPDQIILLLHSAVFALSNNSTEVKNESVGWQEVARNIGCPCCQRSRSCSKIRPTTKISAWSRRRFLELPMEVNHRWRSITDGGSSSYNRDVRDSDYRCGVLFFKLSWIIVAESADRWAGRAGNFQSKVLFEKKESETKGVTTVLQNRMHPSQQKLFDLLGTHSPAPSPVSPLFIRPALNV